MAFEKGHKLKGGRPKGAKTLVKVTDYFTEEEKVEFWNDLKKRAKTDSKIALYFAEQMTGKATQALEHSGNLTISDIIRDIKKKNGE